MRIISVQFRLAENPEQAAGEGPFSSLPFFSGQSRATVTLFPAVWNSNARPSVFVLESVRGRCGDFTPLGWVAENLEGSKRGRDARCPSPQIGEK
jgi:hypothetical protein